MKAFSEVAPFRIAEIAGQELLFSPEDTQHVAAAFVERTRSLLPGSLLPVDFNGIRLSSDAARCLLKDVLTKIVSGHLKERFIILTELSSNEYNLDAMLKREGLVTVQRRSRGPALIGKIDNATGETFEWASRRDLVTARELADGLSLGSISAATNRLTALVKLGLARRVDDRPIPGGGREQLFTTVH